MRYLLDWGDGTTSIVGPADSGTMASANHTWTKGGTFQVKANAIDSKSATSRWSESLNVTIDALPVNLSTPSGPSSGMPGISLTYAVSAIDPDDDQISYTFDWGDGTTSIVGPVDSGMLANANHTWSKAATYQIRAYATDSHGRSSGWSESLMVMLNTRPDNPSTPSGPRSGRPGTLYAYTVSATDPDGDQINYTFDWGDRTTSIVGPADSGTTAGANHTWTKGGTYEVKADATDSKGATSGWSKWRAVTMNAPPSNPSTPLGPISIYAWALNSYSTSASDPDEDPVACTFDWGDENTSTTNFITSGSNTSALHIWSNEGTYQIKVIATDRGGDISEWSGYLTISVIANSKPNIPINLFGPSSGYKGIAHSYVTLASDPDNDEVKYTFDWGDGTLSTTDLVNSGSVESASHAWSKAGTYKVKGNAIDSKGASSMWSKSLNVTIADNDPPAIPIMPSGPTSGRSLTAYEYATSANDPDRDHVRYVVFAQYRVVFEFIQDPNRHHVALSMIPQGCFQHNIEQVRYVFDWGDGTTSWTGLNFIDSGISESIFHKWIKAGTYQVKTMAMDDKGAFSGWSNALVVYIS